MLHDLFTIEIIGKPQGGLNNFEHNCMLQARQTDQNALASLEGIHPAL